MRILLLALSLLVLGCGQASEDAKATVQFRACGDGVPCSPGATCSFTGVESGSLDCECDESQHFFCATTIGGGGTYGGGCDQDIACKNLSTRDCTHDNGYCTRACKCGEECTTDCSGSGPAVGPTVTCNDDCATARPPLAYYTDCSYSDGDCSYQVECVGGPVVTGKCP